MPVLGETKRANEIGKVGWEKHIWHACVDCGKERWIRVVHGKPRYLRCSSCAMQGKRGLFYGELSPNWKGGITKSSGGYIRIRQPSHPRADCNGYVKRAHLVLEEKLGRPMAWWMDSHHINGIKDDDRPENLEELSHGEHSRCTQRRRQIRGFSFVRCHD